MRTWAHHSRGTYRRRQERRPATDTVGCMDLRRKDRCQRQVLGVGALIDVVESLNALPPCGPDASSAAGGPVRAFGRPSEKGRAPRLDPSARDRCYQGSTSPRRAPWRISSRTGARVR